MKVQTTAGQLRAALGAFKGIIDKRQTIPVLGTVRFKDGRLVGTDLDTEVSVTLPSIGRMEGEACVDWPSLHSLARCIYDGETISIVETDGAVTASFNGSEYQMASVPSSDFPSFSAAQGVKSSTGNLGLVAAMNRVRFSISTEETRYYLNGVAILHHPDGCAVMVATNGHQLAMVPLNGAPDGSVGSIIPRHLVHYLCARKVEPVSCVFDPERVRATFDFVGITVRAKLIDGTYPDVSRVIPKDVTSVFSVDRLTLTRVLLRLREFMRASYMPVKLTLDGNMLKLSMGNADCRATETMQVEGLATKPFEAGFNVDYLMTAIGALRGDRVLFGSDPSFGSGPAVITSEGDPLYQLLMPMRVS